MEDPIVQPRTPTSGDESTQECPTVSAPRSYNELEEALKRPAICLSGAGLNTDEPAALVAASAPTDTVEGAGQGQRIVRRAVIIMVGQLLSSVMGMVRIEVINILFYGASSGAFLTALRPIQQTSDLLVGGSVSGALIPTFVDYSAPEKRAELRRIYSTVATLALLIMAVAVVVLYFLAPTLAAIYLPSGTESQQRELVTSFIRITAFGLFGLALYAVGSALLYALKDVVYPAFSPFIQHVGVIVVGIIALFIAAVKLGTPIAAIFDHSGHAPASEINTLQITAAIGLPVGLVLGALGQAMLLLPGQRRNEVLYRPSFRFNHPAVRQILRLYLPVLAGLIISIGQQNLELFLLGRAPGSQPDNLTALASATTLIQFPTGLVVAALSFAVLPALASAANENDMVGFKRTLRLGFRLGLLLMTPAMVGLIALGRPISALLFQHGACHVSCTDLNTLALTNYAYQLPFLALDQILLVAFYARKNTITPMIVSIVAIGVWALVAVPTYSTVGMPALAFANAALNTSHAIILFILLTIAIGDLGFGELLGGIWRIAVASVLMWGVIAGLLHLLPTLAPSLFTLDSFIGQAATVLAVGIPAAAIYFLTVSLLGMSEVRMLGGIVRACLRSRR
jgi:putative peptidoglycan lipid II flippase